MTVKLADTVGNVKGRNADKNARAAKLMKDWDALYAKLSRMVAKGGARTDASLCAYGVLLIMHTGIRVGNEDSAEGFVSVNKHSPHFSKLVQTYGLTTLCHRHVVTMRARKEAPPFRLNFVGKKIVEQDLEVTCPVLCKYRPTAGADHNTLWLGVTDRMLRKFVRRYVGRAFVPKDIRRAYVNRLFLEFFPEVADAFQTAAKKSDRNKIIRAAIEATAGVVGHTPGVCRSAYLSHPMLDTLKAWTPDAGRIV